MSKIKPSPIAVNVKVSAFGELDRDLRSGSDIEETQGQAPTPFSRYEFTSRSCTGCCRPAPPLTPEAQPSDTRRSQRFLHRPAKKSTDLVYPMTTGRNSTCPAGYRLISSRQHRVATP